MKIRNRIFRTGSPLALALVAAILLIPAGCAKKAEVKTAASMDSRTSDSRTDDATEPKEPVAAEKSAAVDLSSSPIIYFEFDSSKLSEKSLRRLERVGNLLLDHPKVRVTVYGHTDERGTDEYNLALGDARARAAVRYLSGLGVSEDRIRVVSYGEEMPAVEGSGAAVWEKNRRDELRLRED